MVPHTPEAKMVPSTRFLRPESCHVPSFSLIGRFCKKGQNLGWVEWFQTVRRSKWCPESDSTTSKAAMYQVSARSDDCVKIAIPPVFTCCRYDRYSSDINQQMTSSDVFDETFYENSNSNVTAFIGIFFTTIVFID